MYAGNMVRFTFELMKKNTVENSKMHIKCLTQHKNGKSNEPNENYAEKAYHFLPGFHHARNPIKYTAIKNILFYLLHQTAQ